MSKLSILFFSIILCCLSSCVTNQELINFRSGKEKEPTLSKLPKQDISNQLDLKLQANDVLAVIIMSPDGILSAPYNLVPPLTGVQSATPTSPSTFIINSDGFIHLPSLGAFKAVGLTVKEFREEVIKKVSLMLENPTVNIRLINFKISVTGEVQHPGVYPVENERITIIEALAKAGDLTLYSDRQHILIIREHDGVREQGEIDLKDTKFFTSPFYYLQQNDVVYVEPNKRKATQITQPFVPYLQPISIGISLLSIVLFLLKK
jgi:polysaccharide biosynthesis/export protein